MGTLELMVKGLADIVEQTGATKIKVADYLPALLFVPLIRWLVSLPLWQQITAWF